MQICTIKKYEIGISTRNSIYQKHENNEVNNLIKRLVLRKFNIQVNGCINLSSTVRILDCKSSPNPYKDNFQNTVHAPPRPIFTSHIK